MLILEIAGGILLAYIAVAAVVGVAMWREQMKCGDPGAQNEGPPTTHCQRLFRRCLRVFAAIGFLTVTVTLAVQFFGDEAALFGMAIITILLGSLLVAIWLDRKGAHLDWYP
jgi:hypothetical protein